MKKSEFSKKEKINLAGNIMLVAGLPLACICAFIITVMPWDNTRNIILMAVLTIIAVVGIEFVSYQRDVSGKDSSSGP